MKTQYVYDHYYDYAELTAVLQSFAESYPSLFRLSSIGTTPEGRNIWLAEVTDTSAGGFDDKPGFALDGNVHAGEVTGSMACMYFLDVLLSGSDDEAIRDLLKKYTVYCVPRISPDGSEFYLKTPYSVRSSNRLFPYDEEQDGIQPEDLDGDGVIRRMRIKNPNGLFKVSPDDPRVMIKRRPDEVTGEFYDVFSEGVLKGTITELQPAPERYGEDFNRNFPGWWGVGGRGGAYGLSAPETYAFAGFLHDHPNICTCLNFHTAGGMYLYPPAFEGKAKADRGDMLRYEEIGHICKEETGYRFVNLSDDFLGEMAPVGGSIDDFCHYVLGIVSFTCECWDLQERCGYPHEFPRKKPMTDEEMAGYEAARLKWLDEHTDGSGWSDWKAFDHPQLGKVEIGGLDMKHVTQNPPAEFIEQELEKHTKFMLREMKMLPKLEISDLKAEDLGDYWRVSAKICNTGYFPTNMTAEGIKIGCVKPVRVTVSEPDLDGKDHVDLGQLNGFSLAGSYGWGMGGTTSNHKPQSAAVSFKIKAEPGTEVTVTAVSDRAGRASGTIILA